MTIDSRRATIQRLTISEAAAGHPIHNDADFMLLAERWIHGELEMPEMRRLYQAVRQERRRAKRKTHLAPEMEAPPSDPILSADELLAEISRMTHSDFNK